MQLKAPLLLQSFQGWKRAGLWRDILAGLTLAAITIPEQMATARLGGFEPHIGFYAFVGATLGFALFGASRVLTAGADSTTMPIFAGALATVAAGGASSLASLAIGLALMIGVLMMLAGVLRLGWIANLLSTPVVTGFLAGIAVHIVVSQLPSLLGLDVTESHLFGRLSGVAANISHTSLWSAAIGLGVLALMIVSERIDGRIPAALIGIVLGTLLVYALALHDQGVATLGALPGGLPHFVLPSLDDVRSLLPMALIVSLVIMIQTAAVSQSFKDPGAREPDIDRDYIGIGAGNIAAAALGTFPIDASPPRTAVAISAGATSQVGALVAAVIVLLLSLWGGGLLAHIPQAALAGVLLFVAQRLIHVGIIAKLAREAPVEGLLGLTTAIAIIALPIQIGVTIGIGLSLLHGVWMTTQTRPVEMRRIPGTTVWWAPGKRDAAETVPGVAVIAFQAPLLFANAETFKSEMISKISAIEPPPRIVILEAGGIADIDFTAAESLTELIAHCKAQNIEFAIARLESVRAQAALTRFGTMDTLGRDRVFYSVEHALGTLNGR